MGNHMTLIVEEIIIMISVHSAIVYGLTNLENFEKYASLRCSWLFTIKIVFTPTCHLKKHYFCFVMIKITVTKG